MALLGWAIVSRGLAGMIFLNHAHLTVPLEPSAFNLPNVLQPFEAKFFAKIFLGQFMLAHDSAVHRRIRHDIFRMSLQPRADNLRATCEISKSSMQNR